MGRNKVRHYLDVVVFTERTPEEREEEIKRLEEENAKLTEWPRID